MECISCGNPTREEQYFCFKCNKRKKSSKNYIIFGSILTVIGVCLSISSSTIIINNTVKKVFLFFHVFVLLGIGLLLKGLSDRTRFRKLEKNLDYHIEAFKKNQNSEPSSAALERYLSAKRNKET